MELSQVERLGTVRPAAAAVVGEGCRSPAAAGCVGVTKGGEGGAVGFGSVMVKRGGVAEEGAKSEWMCVQMWRICRL